MVRMIITIDGPAGAGKSSVARALAKRLGYRFLDTGATYRALAWAAMERQISWDEPERIAALASRISLDLDEGRVYLDGADVTTAIRSSEVTEAVRYIADSPVIRQRLVALQRQAAAEGNVVTEGRDQGTVAFPNAQCKIFLTASPEERAKRRLGDLQARGEQVTFEAVLQRQNRRDQRDRERQVGPLVPARDAIEFNTDSMSCAEVLDGLEQIVRQCDPRRQRSASGVKTDEPS
jgi:cytidylate kinase